MATTPGQRFVRRHDAARSSTSNTTAADISYDTAVLSEGGYSWSTPEVTVDEAGLYLCIYDIGEIALASTRAVGTLVPSVNTTDQTLYKARHRYLRNSGGNHNASWGACILDLSASDDVKIRNPGTVTSTDALLNYATNVNQGGGFQMIRLNAGNFTEVQRTTAQSPITITYANATRPWLDSTLSTTQVTWTSEVRDDDNLYGGSGGDLTLAANTKYLIVYGATLDGSSNQRHTHHLQLEINGNNVQHSTGYERTNASDGPPMQGMYLHETGGSSETLRVNVGVEQEDNTVSNTVDCENAYLQVLELPSSAEWIHVDNSTTDSLTTALAGTTTYYDTPLSATLRSDGDSNLSLDAANDAVQNDSGGSLPVLAIGWHMWDRDAGTSGTRKHCWSYWDNGGTRIAYGISGGYNRGQQGNDDTHRLGYVGAATMDLANAADLSFVVRDPVNATNSDMGIYASTSRYFLGVQVLNLNTLEAAADITVTPTTGACTFAGQTPNRSTNDYVEPASECLWMYSQVGLCLRGQAPTVDVTTSDNVIEQPPAGSLVLTGQTPNRVTNHIVQPTTGSLTIASAAPSVEIDHFKTPNVVALVFSSDNADRVVNNNRGPPVGSLTLAAAAPSAEITHNRSVPAGSLSLTGNAPSVLSGLVVSPGSGLLALAAAAPSAEIAHNKTPSTAALVFNTAAAQALTGAVVAVPSGSLAFATAAPSAEIDHTKSPGVATLVLAGIAPAALTGDFIAVPSGSLICSSDAGSAEIQHSKQPGTVALSLSTAAPSAEIDHFKMPGTASATCTGYAPISINTSDGATITVPHTELHVYSVVGLCFVGQCVSVKIGAVPAPTTGSLTFAGQAATVHWTASPGTGSAVCTGYAPTVVLDAGSTVTPGSGALALNSDAPTVHVTVSPTAGSLAFTGQIPSAELDYFPAVDSTSLVFNTAAPTITVAETNPTIQPSTASLEIRQQLACVANAGIDGNNPNATTSVPSNYEQCDFTGFRQLPGSLKMTWNKHAVRRKSWEERHPQDTLRAGHHRQRGPKRPEQTDRFIGDDIDEITEDDL